MTPRDFLNIAPNYKSVAASQTDAAITQGGSGAKGDFLAGLLIVPASTSPGAVTVKDGGGSAITLFAGGSSSVASLVSFFVPVCAQSQAGGWTVTTGANVSVLATGKF